MEALLKLPSNIEGQPRTYRHRETFDRQIVLPIPYGSAGPVQLIPSAVSAQLNYTNLRIATDTQHIRNTPTLREVRSFLLQSQQL